MVVHLYCQLVHMTVVIKSNMLQVSHQLPGWSSGYSTGMPPKNLGFKSRPSQGFFSNHQVKIMTLKNQVGNLKKLNKSQGNIVLKMLGFCPIFYCLCQQLYLGNITLNISFETHSEISEIHSKIIWTPIDQVMDLKKLVWDQGSAANPVRKV